MVSGVSVRWSAWTGASLEASVRAFTCDHTRFDELSVCRSKGGEGQSLVSVCFFVEAGTRCDVETNRPRGSKNFRRASGSSP